MAISPVEQLWASEELSMYEIVCFNLMYCASLIIGFVLQFVVHNISIRKMCVCVCKARVKEVRYILIFF